MIHEWKNVHAEVILACDMKTPNWRKFQYPLYKADRVPNPNVPWEKVLYTLDEFKQRVRAFLPLNILEVHGAEADDIIAVLTAQSAERGQSVYIQSADADYLQLLKYPNVHVSRPPTPGFVTFPKELKIAGCNTMCQDVEHFLELSVLTGQGGKDNVFNIKTAASEDWTGRRKPPFGVKTAQKLLDKGTLQDFVKKQGLCHRYRRNRMLIDFDYIPPEIHDSILRKTAEESERLCRVNLPGFLSVFNWPDAGEISDRYGHLVTTLERVQCTA
jgi:hypothetical protein